MMQRLAIFTVFTMAATLLPAQEPALLPTGKPVKSLYMVSRLSTMPGSSWQNGDLVYGWGLLHSAGYQFNRVLGAGGGVGFEIYGGNTPISFPVFAEMRTYLGKPKKVSPFGAWCFGWGFTNGGNTDADEGDNESWKGGWMGKFQLGLLIGNHFTVHSGLSVQAMERRWTIPWNQLSGTDELLMQRFEFGVGLSW